MEIKNTHSLGYQSMRAKNKMRPFQHRPIEDASIASEEEEIGLPCEFEASWEDDARLRDQTPGV